MRILITGVCGFVGSSLAVELIARFPDLSVVGVDNFVRKGTELNRLRLTRLGVTIRHGDLRCPTDLEDLPQCDWVIDAAANPSVLAGTTGGGSSRSLLESNFTGLVNVLEYCRRHGSGLVLLSSSRVYSIPLLANVPLRVRDDGFVVREEADLPVGVTTKGISEECSTAPPISLYGSTKLASETISLEYGEAFSIPVWVNRCGVLAGAGQFGTADQGIVSFWLNAHLRRRRLRYIGYGGKGYQTRDVLHPRDLAELISAQIRSNRIGGRRIYNLGGGTRNAVSLAQLTRWCDDRFGIHRPDCSDESRKYDLPWTVMDSGTVLTDFGVEPASSLESILDEIAAHAVEHPDWLEVSGV